jgi:hypothetical protein
MSVYLSAKDLPDSHKLYFRSRLLKQTSKHTKTFNLSWYHSVIQPYWDWCAQYATGKFDMTLPDDEGQIVLLFEKEQDVTAFLLRWK